MALAINIFQGHGTSNEMHRKLQQKKTKVTIITAEKGAIHAVYY